MKKILIKNYLNQLYEQYLHESEILSVNNLPRDLVKFLIEYAYPSYDPDEAPYNIKNIEETHKYFMSQLEKYKDLYKKHQPEILEFITKKKLYGIHNHSNGDEIFYSIVDKNVYTKTTKGNLETFKSNDRLNKPQYYKNWMKELKNNYEINGVGEDPF